MSDQQEVQRVAYVVTDPDAAADDPPFLVAITYPREPEAGS